MQHDVVVIGAGPAGAATALLLARSGLSTCIVERAQFPRAKACGEYLSPGAVRLLADLGVADKLAGFATALRGVRFIGKNARAELGFPQSAWSLPRALLDNVLLESALATGASCKIARAEQFVSDDHCVHVDVRTPAGDLERVRGCVLVGADGAHSLVSRTFGFDRKIEGRRRFALGGHYVGLLGLDDRLDMFVDGRSYFAINPFSQTTANVMLIVDEADLHRRRNDVDAFIRERALQLSGGRIRFADARLDGKRIATGPLAHRVRQYTAPRVVLVGDAAEFLDPFTGQGVHFALQGAKMAANTVQQMLWEPAREGEARMDYERWIRAEITRRKRLAATVGLMVRVPAIASPAAALFARNPRAFRGLVQAVTGAT